MKINKEKLSILNNIVKTEEEIKRLNSLVKSLQTEQSSEERIKSSRYIHKNVFNSEGNFIDYIRKNNITEILSGGSLADDIYISVLEIENDNEFKKRKEELAERIDKIISHDLPLNNKKLEGLRISYEQSSEPIVEQ